MIALSKAAWPKPVSDRTATSAVAALMAAQEDAETAFPTADLAVTHPDVDLPLTAGPQRSMGRHAGQGPCRGSHFDRTASRGYGGRLPRQGRGGEGPSTGEQKALLVSSFSPTLGRWLPISAHRLSSSMKSPPISTKRGRPRFTMRFARSVPRPDDRHRCGAFRRPGRSCPVFRGRRNGQSELRAQ